MSPRALLILRYLADAEPVLTVLALGAFLRVRQQVDLPAMRDYLVVRTLWALPAYAILTFPRHVPQAAYFWMAWGGFLILLILLLRVAVASLDRFFWAFRGLRALRSVGLRWFVVVAMLLTIPIVLPLTGAILHRQGIVAGRWSLRLGGAVGLVEFLAVTSVLVAGLRAGLSPRSRMFGILAGLAMEPAADVILTWFSGPGIWTWNNLIRQIVTDLALTLWIIYFLLPDRQGPMKEPSERLLRWDQVARWVFRDRLPSEASNADAQRTAGTKAP